MRRRVIKLLVRYDYFQQEQAAYDKQAAEHPEWDPEGYDDPGAFMRPSLAEIPPSHNRATGLPVKPRRKHKFLGAESFLVIAQEDVTPLVESLLTLIRGMDADTIIKAPTTEEAKRILASLLPDGPDAYGSEEILEWHANCLIEELKKL